ncbi:ABC transporter ATP-binding protein [Pseudothermotoga thermarum]|uniref:ABC transporter related protein n=1 Tax=Pseudothermotoga thermarum DSM 5069 TaxID=688269 RepID=F7YXI8_9THEM|nr:ABC transporter ATP-binding protein [Pseudothermotoga thermarum]AEH50629.1 ABC transporter related protein [Pseudothermotoga thermarum DSM 5069]
MFVYEIENLLFSYDTKFTLKVEKLQISKGITYVKGPIGSGKTTLLLNLAFLLKGTWKTFKFFGQGVGDDNFESFRKMVTYIPQHPVLLRRTVFENIAYPLLIRKFSKEEIVRKVRKVAEDLKINHIFEKKAEQLSGGQAKLVCIARAFVFDPKVVLLDEPTANLDELAKGMLYSFLKVRSKETTMIIASHDEEIFGNVPCNAVLQIKEGKILKS